MNAIGAFIIAILGWGFLKTKARDSFLEQWIDSFIEKNPHLFRQHRD